MPRLRKLTKHQRTDASEEAEEERPALDDLNPSPLDDQGRHLPIGIPPVPMNTYYGPDKENFLQAIDFDADLIVEATVAATESARHFDKNILSRDDLRMNGVLFRWRSDESSQVLIIVNHCNANIQFNRGFLPCSALCSKVFRGPSMVPPDGVVLKWYCAYFNNQSVKDMALSLLAQLLYYGTTDWDGPNGRDKLGSLLSFEATEHRLKQHLRAQLNSTPVYCFIDSIQEYEKTNHQDHEKSKVTRVHRKRLVQTLSSVAESATAYPFKLLITTTNMNELCELLREADRKIVVHNVESSDGR